MILVTSNEIPGDQRVREVIGLVKGNTVRSRHVGKDILAFFKNLVGGEIDDYTKLLAEAREQSIDRMVEDARAKGADAIVGLRFTTCEVAAGAAEFMVYGTAVKITGSADPT